MTTDIIYRYKNQVYFNITNKCPCRCTFCIRNTEDAIGEEKVEQSKILAAQNGIPLRVRKYSL